MAQQWRVKCPECGKKISDYLRMHSQLTQKEVRNHFADDPREDDPDKFEGTFVECNNCGNVRTVE
jgi:uncharacterized Zn finger protein